MIAAETVLSDVDGAAGQLLICGHHLDELAGVWTYGDVVGLLWRGFFPNLPANLPGALGLARQAVFYEVAALDAGLIARTPVEAGRALLARLGDGDDLDLVLRLVAALDAYLVTVADHGLNASTFAARAGLGSAVQAGQGALKGPLHGGAPGAGRGGRGRGADHTARTQAQPLAGDQCRTVYGLAA